VSVLVYKVPFPHTGPRLRSLIGLASQKEFVMRPPAVINRYVCRTWLVALALVVAGSPALAQTKVRYIEVVRNLAYLPSYVALAGGFFKEQGLDVSLSSAQGGDKAAALMLSNSADITLVGPEVAVYVQNSESPEKLRIFCSLTGTSTNFLVSRQKLSAPFNWPLLKGKTVLGWRPGSTPELFLEYALRKNGIDPIKDIVNNTNIAPPARLGAWLAGTGDFAIFSEPEVTILERDGKGFPVLFVGSEVGRVDYTVFMATSSYMQKNPQIVQAFTNAVHKAQKMTYTADPAELAKLVVDFFPAVTEAQIAEAVKRYRAVNLWPSDPIVGEQAMNLLQDILMQGGVQDAGKRVKYADLVVTSFGEAAKAK